MVEEMGSLYAQIRSELEWPTVPVSFIFWPPLPIGSMGALVEGLRGLGPLRMERIQGVVAPAGLEERRQGYRGRCARLSEKAARDHRTRIREAEGPDSAATSALRASAAARCTCECA